MKRTTSQAEAEAEAYAERVPGVYLLLTLGRSVCRDRDSGVVAVPQPGPHAGVESNLLRLDEAAGAQHCVRLLRKEVSNMCESATCEGRNERRTRRDKAVSEETKNKP